MALNQHLRLIAATAVVAVYPLLVESTVSYGPHTFESMPSHFGRAWVPPQETHLAHMQFLPEQAKLCPEEAFEAQGVEGLVGLVLPNDTLPVALLVERGNCSFEDKATVAMQAYPTVSFLVVYDDQQSKNLVSMRETYSDHGIKLGMLFVSYRSGMALRTALNNQTEEVLASGGPIIELNGLDPLMLHEPSLKDLQTWILIAMGGFFTFITVFGCLLVFVQLGVIPVNGAGQIILTQDAIRRARRLLTREEVARLQPGGDLYGKGATDEVGTQPPEESPTTSNEENEENDEGRHTTHTVGAAVNPPHDPEEDHSCAVCLDDLPTGGQGQDDGNSTLCLPCGHKFHLHCIVPWLTERHATCPLCKFDLLEFIMELDEKDNKGGKGLSSSFAFLKQQARRLCGWSPVRSSDSHSESVTSNNSEGGEGSNEIASDVTPI